MKYRRQKINRNGTQPTKNNQRDSMQKLQRNHFEHTLQRETWSQKEKNLFCYERADRPIETRGNKTNNDDCP